MAARWKLPFYRPLRYLTIENFNLCKAFCNTKKGSFVSCFQNKPLSLTKMTLSLMVEYGSKIAEFHT